MLRKTHLLILLLSSCCSLSVGAAGPATATKCTPHDGGVWRRTETHHTHSSVMIADNNASLWVFPPNHKKEEDPVNLVMRYRSSPFTPSWKYEFSCQSMPKLALSHTEGDVWALGCPKVDARLYNGQALTSSAGSVTLFQWNHTKGRARIVQTIYGKNTTDQLGTSIAMSADGKTIALVASAGTANEKRNGATSSYLDVYRLAEDDTKKWQPLGSTIPGIARVTISNNGNVLAVMTSGKVIRVFRYNTQHQDWQEETFQTRHLYGLSTSSMALAGNGQVLSLLQASQGGQSSMNIYRPIRQRGQTFVWRLDSSIPAQGSSFGWVASLSANGKRIALAEPSYHHGAGAVYVYEYHSSNRQWKQVGDPIHAMVPTRRDSLGRHLHLSQDGSHVIVKALSYTAIYEHHVGEPCDEATPQRKQSSDEL